VKLAIARLFVLPAPRWPTRPAAREKRSPSRSRRALVAGVLLFIAGQALLNVAICRDWVPVRDPVYTEKFDLLRNHAAFFAPTAARPRVLALGSSRTQLGFDAARFADALDVQAFNYGCPAAGPITCALYLRRLLEAGVKPDYLLLEIHPCFLTPVDPPYEARWLHAYRLRPDEVDMLRGFGWNVPTPPQHGYKGWLASAYGYRFGLLNRYWSELLPCPYGLTVGARSDRNGYVAGIELPAADRPRARERTFAQYAPVFVDYHVGGTGCAAIRDILARCADNGIRAAVVLLPESSEYRGWYGAAGYAEAGAFADQLKREFAVPVFDARTWLPDDAIADGHHQTARGGAMYTERLADEAKAWIKRESEAR
jgi:hypothetical protein